ncbi:hypothetical protein NIES593_00540 [Hydrococcus rivularis NIES-593]|uniref:DUF1269 domain-containing protein n=1 Tax=Hydrococcus rivularis NIES-593 TaxID=1921803 RepID=A0A1U7HTN2_9CYAN|nr:DUF1269 domain-containing protein [Hydrococcus rivularis]OKH26898.1 hypothetical protein NIES593_00540 [Hydrococcus rivularis NIES-593]
MSDLIVVGFNDEFKADEVLVELARMQKEHLVDLEDAVVVVKNQKGKVKIKQTQDLVAVGASGGGFWGLLIGLLFLHPLLGVTAGIIGGALSGALDDIGINDDFIRELGDTLEPGTSALFMLVLKMTPDKVIEELQPFDGKVLRTSLSKADEDSLKAALEKAKEVEVTSAE